MSLSPCLQDCAFLAELGPPPDVILRLPPPPLPSFLQNSAELLMASNGTCDFCNWAHGMDVQFVEIARHRPDDTTYFVAIAGCISVIIVAVLVVIVILRCKEAKVKPAPDTYSKRGHSCTLTTTTDGDSALYANSSADSVISGYTQPKVLWSGLGTAETSPYTLQHQPVSREDPELLAHYEYIDYGSVGHTYAYPAEVVHIMNDDENHYCYPDTLDVSFENCGYVDSENRATSL